MAYRKPFHLNDMTLKYQSQVLSKYQHEYLKLPGQFETLYPQEVVFPNMIYGRADDFHSTTEGMIINLEEETHDVNEKTLKKISKYALFASYLYSQEVYVAIICHKDPTNYPKSYKISDGLELHVNYIYFPEKTLMKKYENLINNVEQKEELNKMETLDFAFIPKYIGNEKGPLITESLSNYFKDAIINDKKLKIDIGVLLSACVLKHITNEEKQSKLMEEIGMKQIQDEIQVLVEYKYGDELDELRRKNNEREQKNEQKIKNLKQENKKLKQEKNTLKQENNNIKEKLKQLSKIKNFNSPAAIKLINTLLKL